MKPRNLFPHEIPSGYPEALYAEVQSSRKQLKLDGVELKSFAHPHHKKVSHGQHCFSDLENVFMIEAVASYPVIATRMNGLTCYSSHEHQDLISEAKGHIFIDEWEFMLHLIAPDMRRLLLPVSDQKDPAVINQTEHELAEVDLKRLQASYYAMWQTTYPAQDEALDDEVMLDAVARVAWFLQQRFKGLAEQIVMDYSAQTICLN